VYSGLDKIVATVPSVHTRARAVRVPARIRRRRARYARLVQRPRDPSHRMTRDIEYIGSVYDHAELADDGQVGLIWALSPRSPPGIVRAITGRIQGEWTTVTRLGGTGRAACLRWGSSERMARLPAGTTAPELNRAIAVPMIATSAK